MGVEYSEYDGEGVMPNTVYPKDADALTPSDRLRLQSITGQDADSHAPVDPWHWFGSPASASTPSNNRQEELVRRQTEQNIERQQRARYRESR